jgi:hypothetical protein
MTTADAKVELVARAIGEVLAARHGGHSDAWMTDEIYEEARAAITALEASHSMTEASVEEINQRALTLLLKHKNAPKAGPFWIPIDQAQAAVVEAMQAARPIDQQEADG